MKIVLLLSILYQFVSIQGQTETCNREIQCRKTDITSNPLADENFNLMCIGGLAADQTCKEARITCVEGTIGCTVMCNAKAGCEQAILDASAAEDLMLMCAGTDEFDSCKAMEVICPTGNEVRDSCSILCANAEVCEDMVITDAAGICECTPVEPDACDAVRLAGCAGTANAVTPQSTTPSPVVTPSPVTPPPVVTPSPVTPPPVVTPSPVVDDAAGVDAAIACIGEQVCKNPPNNILACPTGTATCNANCVGKSACEEASLDSNGAETLNANCMGETACKELTVECDAGTDCNGDCMGKSACEQSVFRATAADSFNLDCGAEESSCKESVVFCPTTVNATCSVTCPNVLACEELTVVDPLGTCTCTPIVGGGCGVGGACPAGDQAEALELDTEPVEVGDVVIPSETPEVPAIVGTGSAIINCITAVDQCTDIEDVSRDCVAGLASCTFNCAAQAICKDSILNGNGADEVVFNCGGGFEDACQDTTLDCGNDARNGCTVTCDGKATCDEAIVDGSGIEIGGSLEINCGVTGSILRTEDACKSLTVIPPTAAGTTCTVNCPVATTPCLDVTFNGCACNGAGCTEAADAGTGVVPANGITPSPVTPSPNTPAPVTPAPVGAGTSVIDCTTAVDECTDLEDVPRACAAGLASCTFECGAQAICKDSILNGNGADAVVFNCGGGFEDACQESTLICGASEGCTVNCDGKATCSDGIIDGSGVLAGGVGLVINCGVSGVVNAAVRTEDACKELNIVPPPLGVSCTVNCPLLASNACQDIEFNGCSCSGVGCPPTIALALGNDERIIGIEHGEENNDNNNIDDDYLSSNNEKKITLSLSENTTIHIWAMMAVFLLCNISLYVCYHNKFKVRSDEITRMEKNYSE